jgi:hypothetical protein
MSDRELLELAAKAAGIELSDDHYWRDGFWTRWSPLTDDGDALRLAVRLHFAIDIGVTLTSIDGIQDRDKGIASELHGDDPYAATRRAIVRAAAEIGRVME